MLFTNIISDTTLYLLIYLIVYSFLLITLFWTFLNITTSQFKTLNNLSYLSLNPYYTTVITLVLLSISGVPPLMGFFSKIFLLQIILNLGFSLILIFFFMNLLIGLYFYIQNIKYLHSNVIYNNKTPYILNSERNNLFYFYISIFIIFINILGFNYIDDLFLFIYWLIY